MNIKKKSRPIYIFIAALEHHLKNRDGKVKWLNLYFEGRMKATIFYPCDNLGGKWSLGKWSSNLFVVKVWVNLSRLVYGKMITPTGSTYRRKIIFGEMIRPHEIAYRFCHYKAIWKQICALILREKWREALDWVAGWYPCLERPLTLI